MNEELSNSFLVIGVGNEMRGDDAAGLLVARQLNLLDLPEVSVIEHDGEGTSLLDAMDNWKKVFVVDAVQAGGEVGMIYQLDANNTLLPTGFGRGSTHAFGVAEAIELGRAICRLPENLTVFGIEGGQFGYEVPVSDSVLAAVEIVSLEISKLVSGKF